MVKRFEVYLVNLDDEPSKDAKNTRPAVIVSPDEMNRNVGHVIIAPISSLGDKYPTRIAVELLNNERSIVLDQLRTVDKERLVKKIGDIGKSVRSNTIDRLQEMFAE
jgi:mRNA interferase MazF